MKVTSLFTFPNNKPDPADGHKKQAGTWSSRRTLKVTITKLM